MKIVIFGAKERDTEEDRQYVYALVEHLHAKYGPDSVFLAAPTKLGVGKFVKEKCLEADSRNQFLRMFIDVDVRLFGARLTQAEMGALYVARNAPLFELGDVFVYLAYQTRRGTGEDLIHRLDAAGRPYTILYPGDDYKI